ncbi:hypothetical protein [Pandoraea commovens]|uniref:Uncharacterized protein n=1 Tax=Pandoraea commovens TaxID=2508289 RepID=A0ABY5QIP2_9BURK|nr:hypothetical protein [Pandoraea commovens]UVA80484.1 hypothetical protein NTU39_05525 [Pandoraea commovens]
MADFDDSPDKARRNLITLSAAILAGGYLRPEIPADAKLFGIVALEHVNQPRFWVVLLSLLAYLTIRFIRSSTWSVAMQNWRQERQEQWNAALAQSFDADVLAFLRTKENSAKLRHMPSGGEPPTLLKRDFENLQFDNRQLTWITKRKTHASLEVEYHFPNLANRVSVNKLRFEVYLRGDELPWIRAWTSIWSQFTSNLALEVHLVLLLTGGAVAVVASAFVKSCADGFPACAL